MLSERIAETLKEHRTVVVLDREVPFALEGANSERGEITLDIAPQKIVEVLEAMKTRLGFDRFSSVTAVDFYPAEPRFRVAYHLHSIAGNERVRLRCAVSGAEPEIASATSVYAAANWYERETFDLFGIRFTGHPNLTRIMMPENYQGYPLRRDFPTHGYKYSYQNQQ